MKMFPITSFIQSLTFFCLFCDIFRLVHDQLIGHLVFEDPCLNQKVDDLVYLTKFVQQLQISLKNSRDQSKFDKDQNNKDSQMIDLDSMEISNCEKNEFKKSSLKRIRTEDDDDDYYYSSEPKKSNLSFDTDTSTENNLVYQSNRDEVTTIYDESLLAKYQQFMPTRSNEQIKMGELKMDSIEDKTFDQSELNS